MTFRRAALIGLIIATGACGGGGSDEAARQVDVATVPAAEGGATLNIRTSVPETIRTPISIPHGFPGVTATVPKKEPCKIVASISNETLGFAYDSADISPAGAHVVQSFVTETLRNAQRMVRIDLKGFASSEGSALYNKLLSKRRADAVHALLAAMPALNGVPMTAIGRGIEDPVGDNSTEEGREANRRVELTLDFTGCE
ncbi:MAG TPA: OmpA family protein [Acidimicrobiales bacterium]|jgi:outer membrane protein OmpA-like peptidoglycan-associated protein|nr:OmpA family protein [Acidimicrobiales bacterium]